jgi:hypothetical protein
MGQTKGTYSSPEDVRSFIQQLKKDKVTRLRKLEQIKERQRKEAEQKAEELRLASKLAEEEKAKRKAQEHEEFEMKVNQLINCRPRRGVRRGRRWWKSGLAKRKWELLSGDSFTREIARILIKRQLGFKGSPKIIDEEDDMEKAYVHVRYQKSFDMVEDSIKKESYEKMKQNRKHKLIPIASQGIRKFAKKYKKLRKQFFETKQNQRLKSEMKEPYKPPQFTNIAKHWFKEEVLQKEEEEQKLMERLEAEKKRRKYWMLVRDLHAPKVSELKKTEMQRLIDRVENKRIGQQLPIMTRSP